MANTIDELMRRPAGDWKGPKDPDLDQLIMYLRVERAKSETTGKRAKRGEVAEDIDPGIMEKWKNVLEKRGIKKPKTYRRY